MTQNDELGRSNVYGNLSASYWDTYSSINSGSSLPQRGPQMVRLRFFYNGLMIQKVVSTTSLWQYFGCALPSIPIAQYRRIYQLLAELSAAERAANSPGSMHCRMNMELDNLGLTPSEKDEILRRFANLTKREAPGTQTQSDAKPLIIEPDSCTLSTFGSRGPVDVETLAAAKNLLARTTPFDRAENLPADPVVDDATSTPSPRGDPDVE